MHARVAIAAPIARSADLTPLTGLPLSLRARRAHLGTGVLVEEDKVRRLSELARVTAEPPGRSGRRIEYQMLNGVRQPTDPQLEGLALRYELTAMGGRPIGWEAAKTAGHVHVRPAGSAIGYPEIVEVIHGEAGFLVQDLIARPSGPFSGHAWLVRARPGDWVILPPELAHVTIDLGAGPLVFSDVIDRRATGVYSGVAAARGFAWYVGADGRLRANPRYAQHPKVIEVSAQEWSGPPAGRLYEVFRDDPAGLSWLSDPSRFPSVAPRVWQRVIEAAAASG
jgi:glucose-6-phosphate isomerase, archaeal